MKYQPKYWRVNCVLPAEGTSKYRKNVACCIVCFDIEQAIDLAKAKYVGSDIESVHCYGVVDIISKACLE